MIKAFAFRCPMSSALARESSPTAVSVDPLAPLTASRIAPSSTVGLATLKSIPAAARRCRRVALPEASMIAGSVMSRVAPKEKPPCATLVRESPGSSTFAPPRPAPRIFVPRSYTPIHTVNNGENVAIQYTATTLNSAKPGQIELHSKPPRQAFLRPIPGGRFIIPALRTTTTTTTFSKLRLLRKMDPVSVGNSVSA